MTHVMNANMMHALMHKKKLVQFYPISPTIDLNKSVLTKNPKF